MRLFLMRWTRRSAGGLLWLLVAGSSWGQSGGVLREVYTGIPGTAVADLLNSPTFPGQASLVEYLEEFEAPIDVAEEYGQRLRAYLLPPETGDYRFWIASDDASVLYVSTDDTEANKQAIAWVPGWTNSREWERYAEQRSELVPLTAGQRYYVEALMKEGNGGDNLAVRWQLPSGSIETPIGANRIGAFGLGAPVISRQPDSINVGEGGEAAFAVELEQSYGAGYRWQRDGTDIPGATGFEYRYSPVQVSDDQAGFRCVVTNGSGAVTSAVATLTVVADTTRPTVLAAATLDSPTRISVIFSEPVEAVTALQAGNYTLTAGASVSTVRFAGGASTVVLETSPLVVGTTYQLSISNVRDQASSPNTILPGTTVGVTFGFVPLDIGLARGRPEPLGPSRRRSGLILSEIMYNPAARSDGLNPEFVEIYNSEEISVDLGGYRLSGDIDFIIPEGTVLAPHGFLVIAPAPADVEAVYGISGVLGGFVDRLSNGGGVLRLRHRLDAVLCEVAFDDDPPWPAAADNGGPSLVLAHPSYGEDDPRAWAASAFVGGSPGAPEPAVPSTYRTVYINEILSHTDEPLFDYLELYNYSDSPVDLSGCILTDDPASNRYVFSAATTIPARGFVVVDQVALGFALSAAGETVYCKTPDGSRVIDAVRFGPQVSGTSWGRTPDGAEDFDELSALTPGAANAAALQRGIVINELMYHPPSDDNGDEFIELHRVGAAPLDLSGWRLEGGIEYYFPAGTLLPAGGFLVVAKDRLQLLANHPGLAPGAVQGDYSGSLADGGDTVRLELPEDIVTVQNTIPVTNTVYITADEVTYGDGGRWGAWADGGGSSLELIDPRADNRRAANWADSDETAKGQWTTVEHTGILDLGNGAIDELQVLLLGAGECLLDDIEVTSDGSPNRVPNGAFEAGIEEWAIQGNHVESGWSGAGEGYAGSRALHLRAESGGDNGANRVETDLGASLSGGATATLRARARWLHGHPDLLLRLQGNYLEALGTLPIPTNLGTPGQPNSRALANAGPAISEVTHAPVLPGHLEPVTVLARVQDPDGLAKLVVHYRLDPAEEVQVVPMAYRGAGRFAATLPGQPAGTLLAFWVEAADASAGAVPATFPRDPAGRECLVRFGEPTPLGNFGVYRLWMTQAHINTWASREQLSNQPLDGTFVLGDYRVVYNAGARYRGSPFIRPGYNSPVGNLCAYVWSVPKDDPVLGTDELNLDTLEQGVGRDDTLQRERTSFWIAEQLGVPFSYQRYVHILFNGAQRGGVYSDSQQPNGDYLQAWFANDDRGEIFKIDDWFEFNDAFGFSYVTARLEDYTTTGGVKKKARYRWSWEKKSNRGLDDDYSRLFALVDALNLADPVAYVQTVESLVDVEEWMRIFATRRIVADWDGYSFERGKNEFAYKPEDDGWKMLLWDLDFSLGGGSRDPTHGLFTGVEDPTIQRMYSTPSLVRAYFRAMYDAVYGPLESGRVGPVMSARYAALLGNGVFAADPSVIASWIAQRRSYILSQLSTVSAGFAVTSNGGADFSSPVNLVTLTGTAPVQVRTLTVNGTAHPATWTSLTEWEIRVALGPGANLLQLAAADSSGQLIPGLADTLTITYTGPAADPADFLVINEIMYNAAVPDAAFVEIHNRSAQSAFDLTGYRLDGADFDFPAGTVIEPGAFLVVANDLAAYLAAYGSVAPVVGIMNGRLDNGGETLRLIRTGATPDADVVMDQVTYEDDPPWPGLADGFGPSLQLIDPAQDNNRVANWIANADSGGGTTNVLVDYADVWTYHDGGVDLGYLWTAPAYDDGDWAEGSGLLAVENSALPEPIRTVLTLGANTFYFRKTFTFTGTPASTELWLETVLDDGAVVYLNGVEIWRLGVGAGRVFYSTLASRTVVNADYEGPFALPASALLTGTNLLAVEVHQVSAGNPDIVFGLRLQAISTADAPYTPGAPNRVSNGLPPLPDLWLNEVQPGNLSGPLDGAGDADPWIELYNHGATPLDLSNFFLSPDYGVSSQWPFPPGASLGAGAFLVVWVDGEPSETTGNEYHTPFRLSRYDGAISLLQDVGAGLLVDYLDYGILPDDRSHGAWPDGTPAHRRTFYYATPGATNTTAYPATPVYINEWMSANTDTVFDPADADAEDWFELVNLAPFPVDLSGFHLTDSLVNPTQWAIPANTVIDPGGFLLVWADNETNQNQSGSAELHAGFKLSRDGEQIGLYTPSAAPVDTVTFGAQADDQSDGRWPDGNTAITILDPATPGASNLVATHDNVAPVVGPISDKFLYEQTELRLVIPATDANPGQELAFALAPGSPAGLTLNPQSGLLVWTPTEVQGPGQYPVSVIATDNGIPPLSNSATFTIGVRESNEPPTLTVPTDRQLGEGTLLQVQATATDPDLPVQTLLFSLLAGAPTGAAIDPTTGVFTWTPDEAQGPGTYPLTLVVTDNGSPARNAAGTFTVTVDEVNSAPVIDPIADQPAWIDTQFELRILARDTDQPPSAVAFTLEPGAPSGAAIDPDTGWLRWAPSAGDAGAAHPVTVRVTDSGNPPMHAAGSFSIQVGTLQILQILSATSPGANVIRLNWVPDPSGPNRIQVSDQLENTVWSAHAGDAGTSTTAPADLPAGPGPYRAYRVVVPQP